MSNVIERVTALAGQNFDSRECRVTNPRITARESIELADHIVELIAERDALAATLSEIQQASQDYSDGKITRYEFVKKLAFLAAVQPPQPLAEIRAEAGRAGWISCCEHSGDGYCSIPDARAIDQYAEAWIEVADDE